jgi:Fe-S cluster biogenesis protein NfuA
MVDEEDDDDPDEHGEALGSAPGTAAKVSDGASEKSGTRTERQDSRQTGVVPETEQVLTDAERASRLRDLVELLDLMRPAVQQDGGDLVLVAADVETGVVEVQLQGSCSSCAISASTLEGGVERILTQRLDWVTEVRGGVDESADPIESSLLGRGAYVPKH